MKRRSAIWIGLAVVPTLALVGCGSDPTTIPDTTPPLAPQLTGAIFDDGAVGVWWEPNTEPDLAGYNVYLVENGVTRPAAPADSDKNFIVVPTGSTPGLVQVYLTAKDFTGNESSPSETMRAFEQTPNTNRPIVREPPQIN